jgi:hypothetical protein
MEGKFANASLIEQIREYFPRYLEIYLKGKTNFECKAKIVPVSEQHITGSGDHKQINLENEIQITGIKERIPLTYIENISDAKLTVKVGGKTVGTVENMRSKSAQIIGPIAHGVNDYIKTFN